MQLRNYLPKTLFGRMLSIIMVPMILVQLITIFIFYERHWDTVTRHMAGQLAAAVKGKRSPVKHKLILAAHHIHINHGQVSFSHPRDRLHQTLISFFNIKWRRVQ